MKYTLQKEGKFQYLEHGEGPVLLLLHGLFGALSNWHHVLDHFSQKYKVVIPIMPVYTSPIPDTSVDGLTDYIHAFVKHKKFSDLILLGNSLGGHVGLVYTLHHPDLVKALVLTGSSGLYENSLGGTYPKRKDYNFVKTRTEGTFYDPKVATKELVDEVYEIINNRLKGLKIVLMAKSAIRHNMRSEIKKIVAPTCLIWGKNDPITPPEVAAEFNLLIPNSELYWIDNCGHAPMMEHPERFNTLLDGFLQKLSQKASV